MDPAAEEDTILILSIDNEEKYRGVDMSKLPKIQIMTYCIHMNTYDLMKDWPLDELITAMMMAARFSRDGISRTAKLNDLIKVASSKIAPNCAETTPELNSAQPAEDNTINKLLLRKSDKDDLARKLS
jgi:hypothetical protein